MNVDFKLALHGAPWIQSTGSIQDSDYSSTRLNITLCHLAVKSQNISGQLRLNHLTVDLWRQI